MNTRSSAFALLEMLMAITIGLLIMAGAYAVYKVNEADTKVKTMAEAVRVLIHDAELATGDRIDYRITNTDGTVRLITILDVIDLRGDELPDGLSLSAGVVRNAWGGTVTMTSQNTTGTNNDLIRVQLAGVPSNVCLRMLSQMANTTYDMYVGATLVGLTPPATANATGRNDVRTDQAAPLCGSATTVTLAFRKLKEINYTSMRRVPFETLTTAESARLTPQYTRVENAMTARETAQLALP